MGKYVFLYMWYWFGVVVFLRCIVIGGCLSWVYVHSSICDTDLVKFCSRDVWLIMGGQWERETISISVMVKMVKWSQCVFLISHTFCIVEDCIFLISSSDAVYWCCSDLCSKAGGPSTLGLCAVIYMWKSFGVVVLHGSMIDWLGIHLPWVYVQSSICETHLVSGLVWIYAQKQGDPPALGICAFASMSNSFGVVVLHGSMID